MTPAEKRYYKRHFASDSNQLTLLFDTINAQEEYQEDQAREALEATPRQFKVLKAQLFELLLRSLNTGQYRRGTYRKIRAGLDEVDTLMEKQLFDVAQSRLQRVKQLCYEYQEYAYLYEVLDREYQLRHFVVDSPYMSELEIFEEWAVSLHHLRNRLEQHRIGHQLQDWVRQGTTVDLDRARALLAQPPPDHHKTCFDLRTRLSYNDNLDLLSTLNKGNGQTLKPKQENLLLFKEFSHFRHHLAFNYLSTLRKHADKLAAEQQGEALAEVFKHAREFIQEHPELEPHLIHFYFALISLLYRQRRYSQIQRELEKPVLRHLRKFELQEQRIAGLVYLLLTSMHLHLGHGRRVQDYLRLFAQVRDGIEVNLQRTSYFIEMINHWESGDVETMQRRLHAMRRTRQYQQPPSPLFDAHLDLFQQLVKEPYASYEIGTNFLMSISEYLSDTLFSNCIYFNLDRWLQALAGRCSLAQVEENVQAL